jgi:hypothetical protein
MESSINSIQNLAASSAVNHTAWSALRDSVEDDYFRNWLILQATFLDDAVQGLLVMGEPAGESYAPVAQWSAGIFRG